MRPPQWDRWIHASIVRHMNVQATTLGISMFVEGENRKSPQNQSFAELRIDGPRCYEQSKNYWRIWIAVNFLVHHQMDGNIFSKHDLNGKVASMLSECIEVREYDATDDLMVTQPLVGTLVQFRRLNPIRTNQMGKVDKTLRLEQTTIENQYEMYLGVS